jgi:uncharacterized membrane protein YqgA involved in biofilm formation
MRRTIMQGLGLVTIAVAVVGFAPLADADEGLKRAVIAIVSIILGGIIGELLGLEGRLEAGGDRLRARFDLKPTDAPGGSNRSTFVDGFVVASTVFCAGPLTILGSIEDGLGISVRLLVIKSTLDGFAAIGFAAVYGVGVLASLLVIAVYQGALTLSAAAIEPLVTDEVLAQVGTVGSLLVLGIGLRLLELSDVKVINLVPGLFIAALAAGLFANL